MARLISLILSFFLCVSNFSHALMHEPAGKSVQAQAKILQGLGIDGITAENVEMAQMVYGNADSQEESMTLLLFYAGMGKWDEETWTWTPSSSSVYSFDMEIWDIESMYTDFLMGIEAIGGGEFEITQVREDTSGVDWETGTGTRTVSFCYNGVPYTLEAEAYYDWFDANMPARLNAVFEAEENPKQLYFTYDGYQGLIVFYQTPQWADEFMRKTGIALYTKWE